MRFDRLAMPDGIQPLSGFLSIIPVIVIYPFFQRYFIDGVTIRGIKD